MFEYKINCLKFTLYKVFRMVIITFNVLIMFLLADALSKNFNWLLVLNLIINFLIMFWLGETSTTDKIYTKDGIQIKRIK